MRRSKYQKLHRHVSINPKSKTCPEPRPEERRGEHSAVEGQPLIARFPLVVLSAAKDPLKPLIPAQVQCTSKVRCTLSNRPSASGACALNPRLAGLFDSYRASHPRSSTGGYLQGVLIPSGGIFDSNISPQASRGDCGAIARAQAQLAPLIPVWRDYLIFTPDCVYALQLCRGNQLVLIPSGGII